VSHIVIPGLYLLAGVCVYATVHHLANALHPSHDLTQLLFAGTCLFIVPAGLFHAASYQAQSPGEYVAALRWNIATLIPFFVLFQWFLATYTEVRPRPWLWLTTAAYAVLLVVDLTAPYSLQYDAPPLIEHLHLPWGEKLTLARGSNGPWFHAALALVLLTFGYAVYALIVHYRCYHRRTTLYMLLAMGPAVATSLEGILVRVSAFQSVHLGLFGYLAMVVVMGMALAHELQQRLRTSESRFRALVEQSPLSTQVLSPDGRICQVNAAWEKLWGVTLDQLGDYNLLQDRQLIDKGIMSQIERGFAGQATEIPPIVYNPADNPLVRGPVRDRWVRAFVYPIRDVHGGVREVILMHEDVTDRKRIEDAIRLIASGVSAETGDRFFRQLVCSLAELFGADHALVGVLDEQDRQRIDTLAVCTHGEIAPNLSYTLADTPCAEVVGHATCAYPRGVQRLFPRDQLLAEMQVEGYIGTPLFDADRNPLGLIVILHSQPIDHVEQVQEILEIFAARAGAELQRLRAEADMRRMAYEDYLTRLANRAALHGALADDIRRATHNGEHGTLLLIDLDHFRTINDALSHDVGDEILRAVGNRVSDVTGDRALAARLGGDEFVVLCHPAGQDRQAAEQHGMELAQRILQALTPPIAVGDNNLTVGASIGAVMFPDGGETGLDVLRHAEMALYRAKNQGRGHIQRYLPELQAAASRRLQMEHGLRQAIANDELRLHFQPQLDAGGRMAGAEALLRWSHPEMGDIPPSTFIPIAEETGLIHPIGRWVFEQGCRCLGAWQQAGLPFTGHLSINVCPWQFIRSDFVAQLKDCLQHYRVDPARLMLELTETALLYDLETTIGKLHTLRDLGLGVSLDDFGTGYSSLAYLKDLPLDQIKIDRTFVSELDNTDRHPLVESMLAIGRHMHLEVVAEGVETEQQRDILVALGCTRIQGFLFSHPLPEHDFTQWLSRHRT